MRYLIEKRTVYGRAVWAVVEVQEMRGSRTVARCDSIEDAELVTKALGAGLDLLRACDQAERYIADIVSPHADENAPLAVLLVTLRAAIAKSDALACGLFTTGRPK